MLLNINTDKKNIVIVVLIILLLLLGYYHFNMNGKHKDELQNQRNLHLALTDSLKTYRNEKNEWVNEKLTIQAETKDLKDKNIKLTENQTELIKRVDQINKSNQVIAAALIQMGVKLDGVINNQPVIKNDSTIQFASKTDTLDYEFLVHNVKPFEAKLPVLEFKKFSLPNTQLIEFHWKDDRKEGYPISFTVTNSNPYYKVYNLDSYAIPELEKEKIKPTFWNKLGNFSKSTGGKIVIFGAGFIAGGLLIQ